MTGRAPPVSSHHRPGMQSASSTGATYWRYGSFRFITRCNTRKLSSNTTAQHSAPMYSRRRTARL